MDASGDGMAGCGEETARFLNGMDLSDSSDDEIHECEYSEEDPWSVCYDVDADTRCLFCDEIVVSVEKAINHCNITHHFCFRELVKKFSMDRYAFIKFTNFVRKTKSSPQLIQDLESPLWNDDDYLLPVVEDDPWLMFDIEEFFDLEMHQNSDDTTKPLEKQVLHLQAQLQQRDEQLNELIEQLAQMKSFVHKILEVEDENMKNSEDTTKRCVKSDSSYFESYSHPGIHYDMLADEIRSLGYKNAITNNTSMFSEKIVLDLGCGTGILSMFAVGAGAKRVMAVDNSDIAYSAMDIVRENKLETIIHVVKSRMEDIQMPDVQVDIIISEWMGYFLLFEGMLDSLIFARDHFLKPDGVIVPDLCQLFICGANDPEGRNCQYEFWSDVYGYRMTCIQTEVAKQAIVDIMPAHKIVTTSALLSSFDLYKCSVADTTFRSSFALSANTDTTVTTLVGYFDVNFNLEQKSSFSTSPLETSTHWKQTLFHLSEPVLLKEGEKLAGELQCNRNSKNSRSLLIVIIIHGKRYCYNLD